MQTQFDMKLIKTEIEYDKALERLNVIFDAPINSKKGEEAELLALLIEEYEEKNYAIETPDPIIAILIRMEEMQLTQQDLVEDIGALNTVAEILNRKRKLTVDMIRKLSHKLQLTVNTLIQDYELAK